MCESLTFKIAKRALWWYVFFVFIKKGIARICNIFKWAYSLCNYAI